MLIPLTSTSLLLVMIIKPNFDQKCHISVAVNIVVIGAIVIKI